MGYGVPNWNYLDKENLNHHNNIDLYIYIYYE